MVEDMGRAGGSLQQGMRYIMNLKNCILKRSFVLRKKGLCLTLPTGEVASQLESRRVEKFLVQLFKSSLA